MAAPTRPHWPVGVYVLGFAIGAANHARDFLGHGLRPYRWAPLPLEVFWTSLIVLDALVAGLLLSGRRRSGLALAAAVMIVDVVANSVAIFALEVADFAVALLLQTAFLGFIAESIGFLWPRGRSRD